MKKDYMFTHTLKIACIDKSRKNATEAFKLHEVQWCLDKLDIKSSIKFSIESVAISNHNQAHFRPWAISLLMDTESQM